MKEPFGYLVIHHLDTVKRHCPGQNLGVNLVITFHQRVKYEKMLTTADLD